MRVSTRDNNFINSKGDVFVSISGSGNLFVITVSRCLALIAGLKDKVILEYDDAERRLYIKPLAIADKGALNIKNRQIGAQRGSSVMRGFRLIKDDIKRSTTRNRARLPSRWNNAIDRRTTQAR